MRLLAFLVLAASFLAGCAVKQPVLPNVTSDQLRQRTGLAPPAEGRKPDGSLPPGVNLADGVSEEEAAAVALWNNGQLLADLSSIGIARANLLDAGLLRNPSFQALLPVGTKPFEFFGSFPIEQLVQRPKRIAAAQKQWEQVAQSLVQNGLNAVRDARQAQIAMWQAQERVRAAKGSASLRERIASITAARLRAGDISPQELIAVQADAAAAEEQVSRLESEIPLARERLRFHMGLSPGGPALNASKPEKALVEPPAESGLREKAWASRPDLRGIELSIAAAAERAKWEKSRLYVLAAAISSKQFIGRVERTGPALNFDAPVFRTNAGGIARADAEVELATRQYIAQKQRVDFEVTESRELWIQARRQRADWVEKVMPPLADAVAKARQAFHAGDISQLAVLEASRPLTDAQLRLVDLESAERRAVSELERNAGTRLESIQK